MEANLDTHGVSGGRAVLPPAVCGTSRRAFPPKAGGCAFPQGVFKVVLSLFNLETSELFFFEAGVLTLARGQMGSSGRGQAAAAFQPSPQFSCLRRLQTDLRLPPSAWDGIRAPCITRCLPCYSCYMPQIYDGF